MDLNIYYCTLMKAPDKKNTQTKRLGTITVNIDDIDLTRCHKINRTSYKIDLTAIITLGSEEGIMQVAVEWDGKRCGSGRLKFDGDEAGRPRVSFV
jgi:hypothetical protein